MTLSERIALLLERGEGLRPADLARIAGVSTASVSDWMSGATKSMKPDPARRLSASFGCDQNWLMTGVGVPSWHSAAPPSPPAGAASEPVTVRQALEAIRRLLISGTDETNEKIGEALKQMAMLPDSTRAFEKVLSMLSALK